MSFSLYTFAKYCPVRSTFGKVISERNAVYFLWSTEYIVVMYLIISYYDYYDN